MTCSGSLLGLSGCITGSNVPGSNENSGSGGEEHEEELPEGVSEEEFKKGPVPKPYRTAESQGGEVRDPDNLKTKKEVKFQEATEAVEAGLTEEGHDCGNCSEYITDKNGDGFGACVKVQGYIGTEDWCAIWEEIGGHEDG